jgi:hypothetical protein
MQYAERRVRRRQKMPGQCCHKIIDKATSNSMCNAPAKVARRQFLLLADHFLGPGILMKN